MKTHLTLFNEFLKQHLDMKKSARSTFKKGKVTVVRDYSIEEFFVKKAEQAKQLLAQAKFPRELGTLKTIL